MPIATGMWHTQFVPRLTRTVEECVLIGRYLIQGKGIAHLRMLQTAAQRINSIPNYCNKIWTLSGESHHYRGSERSSTWSQSSCSLPPLWMRKEMKISWRTELACSIRSTTKERRQYLQRNPSSGGSEFWIYIQWKDGMYRKLDDLVKKWWNFLGNLAVCCSGHWWSLQWFVYFSPRVTLVAYMEG